MREKVLQIHPHDNVMVALEDLSTGECFEKNNVSVVLKNNIPAKHKFSVTSLNVGQSIVMYGVLVGKAVMAIEAGDILTTENVKHETNPYSFSTVSYHWQGPYVAKFLNQNFLGYHRNDDRVGTANYWIFIPTVFC